MLTEEEKRFLAYWEKQRLQKKQFLRKFSIGLPLGTLVALALVINLLSGWYKKATMELNSDSSVLIVVLVALIGIVVFITIFSAHHRWDRNETLYQEVLKKKREEDAGMQHLPENQGQPL
jgi:ATP/ADP translocase